MVASARCFCFEPDFGAFVVIVAIAFGILFLGGLDWRLFSGCCCSFRSAVGDSRRGPYRLQRLIAFLDPWSDPFGKGYQLSHSLIAFGRGEWTGVGLGSSVEKLLYLPEAHTDFCSPSTAEELGFAACSSSSLSSSGSSFARTRSVGRRRGSSARSLRSSRWDRRVDRRPGVHQHRRQHGRAADEGTHAAAAVVRRVGNRRELHRARDPARVD
jgi:hypothetical protein